MRKHFLNKAVAMFLVCICCIGVISFSPDYGMMAKAASDTTSVLGNARVQSFISDSRWKVGVTYDETVKGKLAETNGKGSGCNAYARDFAYYVYGMELKSGDKYTATSDIRAGDTIYVTPTHWMVILERNGNSLDVIHGNWTNGKVCRSNFSISGGSIVMGKSSRTFQYGYHYMDLIDPVQIETGVYSIHTARNDNYVLDIQGDSKDNRANLMLYHYIGNDQQKYFIKNCGGYYTIQSVYSGKWMDIAAPMKSGANLQLYNQNTNPEEKWVFEDAGNGYVYMRALTDTPTYVDVEDNGAYDRSNVAVWGAKSSDSQRWRLQKENDTVKVPSGVYTIHTARDDNYVLDIQADSKENRANIMLYNYIGNNQQKFYLKDCGSYYTIQSLYSYKWLDIAYPMKSGANVQLYNDYTQPEEHWVLEYAGDGYVYIRALTDTSTYLDVVNNQAANHSNVGVWWGKTSDSQVWRLEAN